MVSQISKSSIVLNLVYEHMLGSMLHGVGWGREEEKGGGREGELKVVPP